MRRCAVTEMVQGRQNLRTPRQSACSHWSWRVRPANWSKNGKGRENGRGRYAGTPRPWVFEEAAESTALYSPGWKASPTTLRLLRSALIQAGFGLKRTDFCSGLLKRLKLDTGTPEPEVEMAELYVQYERSPYFDRQSGMTLEVLGLTEPIYILSSSSRPSARLLAPLLLFPPLPRSSSSLAHLCCRSTTQPLRRRAACTWETFHTSQRKRRSMTSSTARGR